MAALIIFKIPTMTSTPLSFVTNSNPTDGEVGVLMPSSPLREPVTALLAPNPFVLSGFVSDNFHVILWDDSSCQL